MTTDERLEYILTTGPGESAVQSTQVRRQALSELARILATQFPEDRRLTSVGLRIESLLRSDAAGIY